MGGLGNQMFQIANAVSHSLDYGCKNIFNPVSFTPLQGNQTTKYLDNIFKKINFTNEKITCDRHSEISWEYYNKPKFNKNTEFYGYYQSSKNFINHKDHIIDLFSPPKEKIEELLTTYPEINNKDTLSIHIRRGDSFLNPDIHPMVTKSYVDKALDIINIYSHIFIFSDDKEWVFNTFKFKNVTYVDDEDFNEMWLMSLCKNNIISNSTFSWWGSYLNKNINKRIISPSIWFGPRGPKNYKDIYEKNWEIVEVTYKNGFIG